MAVISGNDDANILTGTAQGDNISALGGDDIIILSAGMDDIDGGGGNDLLRGVFASTALAPTTYSITGNSITSSTSSFDTHFTSIERIELFNNSSTLFPSIIDASGASGVALSISGGSNSRVTGSAQDDFISIVVRDGAFASVDAGAGQDRVQVSIAQWSSVRIIDDGNGIAFADDDPGTIFAKASNAETYLIAPVLSSFSVLQVHATSASHDLQFRASSNLNVISGGLGADRITVTGQESYLGGGDGADTFIIGNMALGGTVEIWDFSAEDRLIFDAQNGINPHFIGNALFSGVAGEYRYDISDFQTSIQIDRDGDALADVAIGFEGSFLVPTETSAGSNVLQRGIISGLIVGTDDDDTLKGTDQADLILGLDDSDIINGGRGNDILVGGEGEDVMRGGAGADAFVFLDDGSIEDKDRILDFGDDDILVMKTQIFDNNNDGIIAFGNNRLLDLDNGNIIAISGNGRTIRSLEYDGQYDLNGERFYIYSKLHSVAGIETFADMALNEYLI